MKSKSIFLMAVSLGFGLVAAIGITQVMGRSNKSGPVKEEKRLPVLIAVKDIDANQELVVDMFREEEWPARLIPEGVVTTLEEIEGMVSVSRVKEKGIVLQANLLDKDRVREKRIPSGYKVIGIKLGADDHLYGLLEPGDLVDIMAIFRGENGDIASGTTRTFLRKVKVWSIGSRTRKVEEMELDAKGSTVVGLLVDESQSEKIIHAQRIAELKLAMRGDEDIDPSLFSSGTERSDLVDDEEEEDRDDEVAYDDDDEDEAEEKEEEAETEVAETSPRGPKPFTVVVHTSSGPVQYHFNQQSSYVPNRIEGYNASQSSTAWPEDTVQPYVDESNDEVKSDDQEDDEDDDDDDDSDSLMDELDSEPRN